MTARADRSFFACDAAQLAVRLIGQTLVRQFDGVVLRGRIVETEAYVGVHDAASHAYRGKCTDRNRAMFGEPGVCYVYFTYGMHHCVNISCAARGDPQAVLIRALEVIEGRDEMIRLRGRTSIRDEDLCKGPANLTRAFKIDRSFNQVDVVRSRSLFIELPRRRSFSARLLVNAPRVGISAKAGDWRFTPLRWYLRDSRAISRPR